MSSNPEMTDTVKEEFNNSLAEYMNARDGYKTCPCELCDQRVANAYDRLWAMVSPHPDPAEEPPTIKESLTVAPACPPQTPGEEIPEGVLELIEKHRGYQVMRDERGMTGVLPVVWLADSRSRLLTALDEKEKLTAKLFENVALFKDQRNAFAARCNELQSAAVLQKEELEQMRQHTRDYQELQERLSRLNEGGLRQ